ncbi:MAG: type VII secretion protein EccB [Sciscionella sp.]
MPSTPTTKSQVQAYKFVIRRMQSALVRKDAVMLHDPMRTHSRATMVGVALAVVGLAGFLIYGLISPKPTPPDKAGIVISQQTGQVYVLTEHPRKLIPTFNLASARLILLAQQEKNNSQGSAQAGQPARAANAVQAPPDATVVDEEFLRGIAKARKTGIPDGPEVLPSSDSTLRTRDQWAVCDQIDRNQDLNDQSIEQKTTTTVLAGKKDLGASLGKNQGLLVTADGGTTTYLVYRTPSNVNKPGSDAVRAEVDLSKGPVRSTFNPDGMKARKITPGLLNAIPPVDELKVGDIQGRSEPSNLGSLPDIGSVVTSQPTGQAPQYYVVLKGGLQHVTKSAADVIRSEDSANQYQAVPVKPDQISQFPQDLHQLQLSQFPDQVPELLDPNVYPTVCLSWRPDTSDPDSPKQHTAVTVGSRAPAGKDDIVPVGSPNSDGIKIDQFYMPSGTAAVVHSATSPADFGRGPIYVISDRGVRYSVPDTRTAIGLGLDKPDPAPDSIVRLLPSAGTELSTQAAQRSFDAVVVPDGVGRYPPPASQPSAAEGAAGTRPVPGG